jgi:hypothetical protein
MPSSYEFGEITMLLPNQLAGISFGQSDRDELLQLADVLAGSAAHMYAVMTRAKPVDDFARDLNRAGIARLIGQAVGPEPDPSIVRGLR